MRTNSNLSANHNKKAKENSPFWDFMGGDFLLKESVVRWYPFILILFVFSIVATQNEAFIANKYKKIKDLDNQYKKIKTQLRFENEFIYYDISPEIITLLEEQGFVQKDNSTFKIPVKSASSSK